MRLACSSAAFRQPLRDAELDFHGWLRLCAQDLDVDGIEIDAADLTSTSGAALREIKQRCTNLHLTIAGIAAQAELTGDAASPVAIERVQYACDLAAYLGAPIVRLEATNAVPATARAEAGRVAGLFRRVFGERSPNNRRAWSDLMWSLRTCADYAGERGVTIAVQNIEGSLIAHGPAIWQSVRDVGSPWLRGCINPIALTTTTGLDLAIAHTVQVRAVVRRVQDDGSDAAFYWPEALRALRLGGYRGFVTLDYTGAESAGTALPRSARYLLGVLQLLQRQELLEPAPVATVDSNGVAPHAPAALAGNSARRKTSRQR